MISGVIPEDKTLKVSFFYKSKSRMKIKSDSRFSKIFQLQSIILKKKEKQKRKKDQQKAVHGSMIFTVSFSPRPEVVCTNKHYWDFLEKEWTLNDHSYTASSWVVQVFALEQVLFYVNFILKLSLRRIKEWLTTLASSLDDLILKRRWIFPWPSFFFSRIFLKIVFYNGRRIALCECNFWETWKGNQLIRTFRFMLGTRFKFVCLKS